MLEQWALERSRWKKQLAWWGWMDTVLRRSAMLHALCEEERASLRRLLPRAGTIVIPNGVDLPSRAEIEGARDRTVVFLGRLHPKKGLIELIQGWASSSVARNGGWNLVIAGWDDGGHEATLRDLVKARGLVSQVTFAGPVYGEAKKDLLRRAGAFVLTSFSEGLPMAVLEAWSYGVPVLMTDECHLSEGFADGAAVRVDPEPRRIAEGLDCLLGLSDQDRVVMGLRGRQLVEQRFNWLVIGRQMADMYDGLVDQSAAAAAVAIPRRETDEDLLEADTIRLKLLIGHVPPQRLASIRVQE
jgi:poly(glycerol-phosphate) alpha-glucosyltransferase